ncbi:desmoplakin isoform X2 [Callorhinchus milii]|uniref:desmoplakin isoform X2 n=1 Tax=Callorhinchus milii TaxID=7868 RepID=UPI001C3FD72A|nr:desmoplakin isoform X2 [Callorhinchus milii]
MEHMTWRGSQPRLNALSRRAGSQVEQRQPVLSQGSFTMRSEGRGEAYTHHRAPGPGPGPGDMYLPGVCAPEFSGNPETILLSEQQFPTRMRGQSFKQLQSGFDQRETFHRGDSYILQQPGAAGGGAGGGAGAGAKNVEIIKTIKTVHNSNSLTKRYAAARAGVDECELKLRQAEVLLQNDLKGFEVGQPGRNRIEIDNLLKMCGDMISEIEEAIEDLKYSGQPFEPIQNRVVQLYDQLRVISKAIYERYSEQVVIEHVKLPGQRVSIGNNSWDESYSRSTHELVSWINQQKQVMGVQEWALDAVSVEEQIKEQKRYHKIIEDFRWKINKVKVEQNENYSENYRLAISEVEDQYEGLLKGSNERIDQLIRFQDIIKVASNEIMWINDREEEELVYDWSDKNTNIAEKQERFSMLMSNLEVKEKQLNRLKQEGDKLVANQHPAANRIEAYVDALQTQWSWVLQLTKCIEVHLKENTNYFQFFEEAQMVEKDLKKMQDSIRKKFICDKSTPALQLEKMITESEKDKDKILEYKRQMTNLVNKSKNIVQLKPRNPLTNADQRSGNKIILKALCDYKQDQKAVHKDDKCILLDNSQRSKWKVIGPGGIEMMVPSVCLLIPPPNHAANDLANKIEQYYEAILSLWNQLYINMKSLMSWQYCVMDMQKIRSWTLLMLKQMSREDYETVTKNLELNFQAFLKYSKTSQFFTEADRTELQKDYSHSQTHFSKLVTSLEDGPPDRQISVKVLGQGPPQSDSNFHLALQTIRHRLEENEQLLLQKIHLLIDSASTFNNTRRTAELELTLDDLDAIDNDFVKLQKKWHLSNPSLESKLFFEKEFLFIAQRLKSASRYSTDYLERMKVLNLLIQSILEVEDIVKVYEARLTEEESVPLDLDKIEPYRFYLKTMRGELDMKRDLLKHMDDDLNQVLNINERITSSYKCDIDIDKYNEKVTQLKDRWQRIYKELDSRYLDLDKHHRQLNDYKQLFDGLNRWIDVTKCKQDALQINKFGHAEAIIAQLQEQKNLHSEIKNKRVNVEEYQSDADMCATSIKDYELQLASFSAGLETLLKIPIKRQVAQSASTNILRESADLQSRYIELLTRSGDYYKCLSEMLKNTEEVKATNKIEITRISREEILHEKESLLLKIRLLEQDKSRLQHYEDELSRIKALLETESRSKLHMQDEIQHVKTDLTYWKSQAEMKDQAIRHQELDKGKATSELDRLKAEITRLEEELRMLEERCKWKLATADREKQSELEALRIQLQMEIQRLSEVPKKEIKLLGIRDHVSLHELVNSEVIDEKTASDIETGRITAEEVSHKYQDLLQGKSSIAGIFVEATREKLSVYQAMRKGLIRRGTALELLEAQAATGHMIDPVKNLKLTVEQAAQSGLIGLEFKNKLLSAEKAVTGYKDPETGKLISLFQAMKKELIEPTHGIRLLEAQIATGGIIDPTQSHRLPVHTAYKRNYFDEEMNQILIDPGDDTKGFFDPNTEENLTYLQLMERCVTDKVTNLCLLQLTEKKKTTTSTSAVRKRRIVIVDPDTNREMSVREAYHKDLIDYETFVELSEQEAEWEEITISGSDGSVKTVVVDRKTGIQYDIEDYLKKGLIDKKSFDDYRAGVMSLTQFAELFSDKTNVDTRNVSKLHHSTNRSPSPSPQFTKTLFVSSDEFSPIAAIFDIETLEKITISEAVRRNIVDSITGQRLLEAQACTGGIINPGTNQKLLIQDSIIQGIIDEDMGKRLKPAQKAFVGFEDVKNKKKLSAAEAIKENWLPYEAGNRFLEYQFITGGLVLPNVSGRIPVEEAIRKGLISGKTAQKLQDFNSYSKNLTCPKTKLKISYKEAMDRSMVEEKTGLRMLEASSFSSKGINSPYNLSSSGPNSRSGSRSGSRGGSRRGSFDATSSTLTTSTSTTFVSNISVN